MSYPSHVDNVRNNMDEVESILGIRKRIIPHDIDYKHELEVLNKSALVLLVACFESYLEDLAEAAFDIMIENAQTPDVFPGKVLSIAVAPLTEKSSWPGVWKLAGEGWREILIQHKILVLKKHTGAFNSPKSHKIDDLFNSLIGIKSLTGSWHWNGMSTRRAVEKLDDLVSIRGDLAHRLSSSKRIYKKDIVSGIAFIKYLIVLSHNHVNKYLAERTGQEPWIYYKQKNVGVIKKAKKAKPVGGR